MFKIRCLFVLILSICLSVSNSWAKTVSLEDGCRQSTVIMLEKLENAGFSKIGDLSISSLIQSMKKTQWGFSPVFFAAGEDGKRMSGLNLVEENVVNLGYPFLDAYNNGIAPLPLNAFIMHEALGANGIKDDDYALSLAITIITQFKKEIPTEGLAHIFLKRLNKVLTYKKNIIVAEVTGGTGVGGGGDIAAVDLKYKLLHSLPFYIAKNPDQKTYRANAVSTLEKVLSLDVKVDYSGLGSQIKKRFKSYSVTINHNQWFSNNQEYQNEVLGKLAHLMGEAKRASR